VILILCAVQCSQKTVPFVHVGKVKDSLSGLFFCPLNNEGQQTRRQATSVSFLLLLSSSATKKEVKIEEAGCHPHRHGFIIIKNNVSYGALSLYGIIPGNMFRQF